MIFDTLSEEQQKQLAEDIVYVVHRLAQSDKEMINTTLHLMSQMAKELSSAHQKNVKEDPELLDRRILGYFINKAIKSGDISLNREVFSLTKLTSINDIKSKEICAIYSSLTRLEDSKYIKISKPDGEESRICALNVDTPFCVTVTAKGVDYYDRETDQEE